METKLFTKNLPTNTKLLASVLLSPFMLSLSCEQTTPINPNECLEISIADQEVNFPNDYYLINEISVDEKDLLLNISHSGGCQEHEYELFLDPLFCTTPPIYLTIRLSHNSNNDLCEAWITKNLCFDISSIYNDFPEDKLYIEFINYPHQSDTIWLFE
jgi:hypothetical protein